MAAFPNRTGRGIRIGIADSGVNPHHPQVRPIASGCGFVWRDGLVDREEDFTDLLGHGTAVAAAIREKAPEAEVEVLRIFRRRLAAPIEVLAAAIEWAIDRKLHLLNLSLGLPREQAVGSRMREKCRAAEREGLVILAAAEAGGAPSIPGSFPEVLGVKSDPALGREEYRVLQQGRRRLFAASPWARDLSGLSRERNLHGVSLAVANLSGIAARALEIHGPCRRPDLEEVLSAEAYASQAGDQEGSISR